MEREKLLLDDGFNYGVLCGVDLVCEVGEVFVFCGIDGLFFNFLKIIENELRMSIG